MTITVGTKIKVTNTTYDSVPNGTIMTVTFARKDGVVDATVDGGDGFEWFIEAREYEVLEDNTQDTPTLWKDMTPEEKGALLLAHHEGKTIEWNGPSSLTGEWVGWEHCGQDCLWDGDFGGTGFAYRIATEPPKPVVGTVELYGKGKKWRHIRVYGATHSITFDTIDGVPDTGSIKMVEV